MTATLLHSLTAFLLSSIAIGVPIAALGLLMQTKWELPCWARLSVTFAAFSLLGYVAFWAFFIHRWLGNGFTWAIFLGSAYVIFRYRHDWRRLASDGDWRLPAVLTFAVGLGYLGILHLYPANLGIGELPQQRFVGPLPMDNEIPRIVADRLVSGMSLNEPIGDWLVSDRPPLQAGVIVAVRPLLEACGVASSSATFAISVWFQLTWIPAGWAVARWLGARHFEAVAVVVGAALTGFCLLNSVFVWPKLGAAALVLTGFVLWFSGQRTTATTIAAAACCILGWLSHGGVAFSLIAFAVLAAGSRPWPNRKSIVIAGAAALALMLPWQAYQKLYDPPANRLLKMHLAGVVDIDSRSTSDALIEEYQKLGWDGTWAIRKRNWQILFWGNPGKILDFSPQGAPDRMSDEFFSLFRAFAVWNFAILAMPLLWLWRSRRAGEARSQSRRGLLMFIWAWITTLVWVALLFQPNQTIIHQGSYAMMFAFLIPPLTVLVQTSRPLFALLAATQAAVFFLTWGAPSRMLAATPQTSAVLTIITAIVFGWLAIRRLLTIDQGDRPTRRELHPTVARNVI